MFRGSLADLPTSVRLTKLSLLIQEPEIFRLKARRERICTLAFASTRWLQSSTDLAFQRCAPLARHSSYSAITRVLRFVWPRSWNCRVFLSSPTTPWETAKTALRTNRSSTSYPFVRYQG